MNEVYGELRKRIMEHAGEPDRMETEVYYQATTKRYLISIRSINYFGIGDLDGPGTYLNINVD